MKTLINFKLIVLYDITFPSEVLHKKFIKFEFFLYWKEHTFINLSSFQLFINNLKVIV